MKSNTSKFRHVYGKAAKPEKQYLEIPSPLTSGEGTYVRASSKYFAFSGASIRKLYVRSLSCTGRFSSNESHIGPDCLKGKIWDFDFHPSFDNIMALGDDSGKVAIVTLPDNLETDGKLLSNVTKATVDLGTIHSKKVVLLNFHPCANNLLATASFDRTVKLSNIEDQSEICNINGFGDTIYSIGWNKNGSLLGITSKDKNLRIVDPRVIVNNNNGSSSGSDAINITVEKAFDGAKSTKLFWVDGPSTGDAGMGYIGSTGFTKSAKRCLRLWDVRNTVKPVVNHTIDQAASILMPRFDSDNNILYLAGKGDGSIQFGEFRNGFSSYHVLSSYRSPDPQRGGGWVPKRGLNVWKCEIERFLKLTRKSIIPVSFIVPRKSGEEVFQSDIYPDAPSGEASMTVQEWLNGENKDVIRMSLDPSNRENYTMTYRRSTLQQTKDVSKSNGSSSLGSPTGSTSITTRGRSSGSSISGIDESKEESTSLQSPRIAMLEKENSELRSENTKLLTKIKELEAKLKEAEQNQQSQQQMASAATTEDTTTEATQATQATQATETTAENTTTEPTDATEAIETPAEDVSGQITQEPAQDTTGQLEDTAGNDPLSQM